MSLQRAILSHFHKLISGEEVAEVLEALKAAGHIVNKWKEGRVSGPPLIKACRLAWPQKYFFLVREAGRRMFSQTHWSVDGENGIARVEIPSFVP
jgi:hypothetical protein